MEGSTQGRGGGAPESKAQPVGMRACISLVFSVCFPLAIALSSSLATAAEPIVEKDVTPESGFSLSDAAARLHAADPVVVAGAETKLREQGLQEVQLSLVRMLKHPDPKVRGKLARLLADVDPEIGREFARNLLEDPDPKVRTAVLESLRSTSPDHLLAGRIEELAEADPAPGVRGYAKLLSAEWSLTHRATTPALSVPTTAKNSPPGRPIIDQVGFEVTDTSPDDIGSTPPSLLAPSPLADPVTMPSKQMPLNSESSATVDIPPSPEGIRPEILDRPLMPPFDAVEDGTPIEGLELLSTHMDAPLGFTGPTGVMPTEEQENSHFVPVEDRWREGFPEWDRYDKDHPFGEDYPYSEGHWWDPYNQNVLKGDYPIIGQHTFLNITGSLNTLQEFRNIPTATTPFESTVNPFENQFFGNNRQYFTTNNFRMSINLSHGNGAFKPVDWQIRLTPIFNINYLDVNELGIVEPDVEEGTTRFRDTMHLEEWFIEKKLADLSPDYDFVSLRVGSQPFTSDFRGFIFSDTNRAVRLFGTRLASRDQFNLLFFDQTEKDTNSLLNTFNDRHQNTVIANYIRQDFIFPGYNVAANFHYNNDHPSFKFDKDHFLVRPDPVGVFQPHRVEAYYLGLVGDGHIGWLNLTNAFYYVTGRDSMNPLAGKPQQIDAKMLAIEASVDRDWVRFRSSFFYSSGDHNVGDNKARGFDTIFDSPNFAGGNFSYWQRQQLPLFGTSLTNRFSIVPDLRSSKFQGQSNFVNPGLFLYNLGMDFEVTPKLRFVTNASYLMFDSTAALQTFTFQSNIDRSIGTDLSIGTEYRPFLNDNVIVRAGFASLIAARGFKDLYGSNNPFNLGNTTADVKALFSSFVDVTLTF